MVVRDAVQAVRAEIRKAIAGQDRVIEQILVAILSDGHVLIEGVPGLGKTLLIRTFARTFALDYGRIQFTPDLMPSDIIGTTIFDPKSGEFKVRKGPVFTNILLADEINRTPPKTQAALLEAMEERRVTIDGEPHPMPPPFLVFATQNPIDFEGTYPLPEAQLDRFMMKTIIEYPPHEAEREVLRRHHQGFRPQSLESVGVEAVIGPNDLLQLQQEVTRQTVEEKVFDYILAIVRATRDATEIAVGASPRAGISLMNAAKAVAAIRGREFVIPDDVKEFALPVLRHRVLLRPEAEIEGLSIDRVLTSLIDAQIVPR
jgi:MoxR-like ATPase